MTDQTCASHSALPGGISSGLRALPLFEGKPFVVHSSRGSRLVDVEGRSHVDYAMAMGANILGHAHEEVVEACIAALRQGAMPGFRNDREEEAAAALAEIGGSRITRATFTTTGTEAVQLAMRAARAKTGRPLIAKTVGGYDGWLDNVRFGLVGSPEARPQPERPRQLDVTLMRVNDLDDLEALFARHGHELAGILIEPILGNIACLIPEPAWVARLNALCAEHGVMIISDEVLAGLRAGFGLFADAIGLRPDYVTMGKAIGTGNAVAAVLGTPEAFSIFEDGTTPRYGTYHGNLVACAAVQATMAVVKRADFQSGLFDYGAKMRAGIRAAYAAEGLAVTTAGCDGVFSLWFTPEAPRDYDGALTALNPEATRLNYEALRRHGVVSLPSPWGRYFPTFSHGAEDLEITLNAFRAAARDVAAAGCVAQLAAV